MISMLLEGPYGEDVHEVGSSSNLGDVIDLFPADDTEQLVTRLEELPHSPTVDRLLEVLDGGSPVETATLVS